MTENNELFTTRMRKATRKIHSVSDALVNTKFAISVKCIFLLYAFGHLLICPSDCPLRTIVHYLYQSADSLTDEEVWGGGLFVFYHIFAFLEGAKERLNMNDLNKLFVNKILYRKQAFEEDLAHYLGENWQSKGKSLALENYIEHLQNIEKEQPMLLMAYVYHLYLGLLSGGQILAKKRKMFGEKNAPQNVYADKVTDFGETDLGQLKKEFRNAMNEIAERMTKDEQDAFIEESNQVFLMNNLIVNSIEGQNKVLCNYLYKASALLLLVFGVIFAYKMHK